MAFAEVGYRMAITFLFATKIFKRKLLRATKSVISCKLYRNITFTGTNSTI